jgi:hypothetical protein
MSTRVRRAFALLAALAALTWVTAAQALTMEVGTPDLVARVAINVPVTVNCAPFSPGLAISSQTVSVRVEQAAGHEIAFGTASVFSFGTPLFPCDGAEHTILVTVLADPAGAPFHGGKAVLSASARSEAGVPLPFGGFGPPFESQISSVAPTAVRLR